MLIRIGQAAIWRIWGHMAQIFAVESTVDASVSANGSLCLLGYEGKEIPGMLRLLEDSTTQPLYGT